MRQLCAEETLPRNYRVHALKGKFKGHLECHLEPDFLLIWYTTKEEVVFVRAGSHSDLLGE
jgi:mRNA interferase YafQ